MIERLGKIGSIRTLHEIYGLLHGCIAAPCLVMPSHYLGLIFGGEGASFDSEKDANDFMGSFMALWNRIAGWSPETEPFPRPAVFHPNTPAGLKDRVTEYAGLITYFVKGLDLGRTQEPDFSDDALDALKSLSEAQTFLEEYARLVETDKTHKDIEESFVMIGKLEEVTGDCISRINIGLKAARMQEAEEMCQSASGGIDARRTRSEKIGRNEPCPCGSGKKYKKCCGLTH